MDQKKALCTALRYTTLGPVLYFDETQGQVNYVLCPILYYTILHYAVLYYTVLHCTYYTVQHIHTYILYYRR